MKNKEVAEVDAFIFANGVPSRWDTISAGDVLRLSNNVGNIPSNSRKLMKSFGIFQMMYMYMQTLLGQVKETFLKSENIEPKDYDDYRLMFDGADGIVSWKLDRRNNYGNFRGMPLKHYATIITQRLLNYSHQPLWTIARDIPIAHWVPNSYYDWTHEETQEVNRSYWDVLPFEGEIDADSAVTAVLRKYYERWHEWAKLEREELEVNPLYEMSCKLVCDAMIIKHLKPEDLKLCSITNELGWQHMCRPRALYCLSQYGHLSIPVLDQFYMFCVQLQLADDHAQGMWPSNHYPHRGAISSVVQEFVGLYPRFPGWNPDVPTMEIIMTSLNRVQHLERKLSFGFSTIRMDKVDKHLEAALLANCSIRVPCEMGLDLFGSDLLDRYCTSMSDTVYGREADAIRAHLRRTKATDTLASVDMYLHNCRTALVAPGLLHKFNWLEAFTALMATDRVSYTEIKGLVQSSDFIRLLLEQDIAMDTIILPKVKDDEEE
jgi:hypothetical protein